MKNQIGNGPGESNGHVTDDITWPFLITFNKWMNLLISTKLCNFGTYKLHTATNEKVLTIVLTL